MKFSTPMSRHLAPTLSGLAAATLVLAAGLYIDHNENQRFHAHRQAMLIERMATLRAGFEQVLNTNLAALSGLEALVESCGRCGAGEYQAYLKALAADRPEVRALQLAPDAVVTHVYPLTGNEAAIGLDLRALPGQSATVTRTIREGLAVLAGPVTLRQGGTGLIGRRPIFIPDPSKGDGEARFWGFATVVLDFPRLVERAGWKNDSAMGTFALRGANGRGMAGAVFLGDPEVFKASPLTLDITFPNGTWELAALPPGGWRALRPGGQEFRAIMSLLATLAGIAGVVVARLHQERGASRRRSLEACRSKSNFMARMSHELRTPLNAIIGFAETISTQTLGPVGIPRYREYAEDIHQSGLHLLATINSILDMEKAEAGHLQIHPEVIAPAVHASEAIRLLAQRAETAGVALETDLAKGLPPLHADPRALRDMLFNLLSNAIKFTDPGGRVRLRMTQAADGGLLVAVADTGIGIAPEDIPAVLSPFGQVDNRHTRSKVGTGLGLSLTRHLIELHGGRLEIASRPGVGTTVTLVFPPERVGTGPKNETAPEGAVAETA